MGSPKASAFKTSGFYTGNFGLLTVEAGDPYGVSRRAIDNSDRAT
jgi:hypothetical protein